MRFVLPAAAIVLSVSLAGCGSGGRNDVASDPGPTTATGSSGPTKSPTAEPTVGTYPEYGPTDYTFELTVSCFCAFTGMPVEETVVGGAVTSAVYGKAAPGRSEVRAGDPADKSLWLTINDVIAHANDTQADKVKVDWPSGQDYPTSVYVDSNKRIADEEVGYTVAKVQAG